MKNIHKIGIWVFILILIFILILSYQTWKQNITSCSCSKGKEGKTVKMGKEGMSIMNQELKDIVSKVTVIINTLNGMSNELNKLKD
jgi:hypothetical protein